MKVGLTYYDFVKYGESGLNINKNAFNPRQ